MNIHAIKEKRHDYLPQLCDNPMVGETGPGVMPGLGLYGTGAAGAVAGAVKGGGAAVFFFKF